MPPDDNDVHYQPFGSISLKPFVLRAENEEDETEDILYIRNAYRYYKQAYNQCAYEKNIDTFIRILNQAKIPFVVSHTASGGEARVKLLDTANGSPVAPVFVFSWGGQNLAGFETWDVSKPIEDVPESPESTPIDPNAPGAYDAYYDEWIAERVYCEKGVFYYKHPFRCDKLTTVGDLLKSGQTVKQVHQTSRFPLSLMDIALTPRFLLSMPVDFFLTINAPPY